MSFKIRTSAPTTWNKLYNNANNGGLSWCIDGRPTDPVANVLSNCVGYACSRFNEIYNELTGYKNMKYPQLCCDAENFWTVAPQLGLKRGQTPQAGSIMVWEGIGSAPGHVAIVERVVNDSQVYTSESGYDSAYFWNSTRYKGDGNWGTGAGYRFLGFIYNPAVKIKTVKYCAYDIKRKQWLPVVTSTTKVKDTAGVKKEPMGAITIKSETLKKYCVKRAKQKNFDKAITGYGTSAGKYAGNKTDRIVAIAIYDKELAYRVKLGATQQWLPTIYGKNYNLKNINTGYAGDGKNWIDEIEIWRVK